MSDSSTSSASDRPKKMKASTPSTPSNSGSNNNNNNKKKQMVSKLGKFDILMGRGAFATDYEGNLRLRELVMERYGDYASTSRRCDKHAVAKEIVQIVLQRGGRFLQSPRKDGEHNGTEQASLPSESNPWVVVTDQSVLITKVKQLLRDAGKETREKVKSSTPSSSSRPAHRQGSVPTVVRSTIPSPKVSDYGLDLPQVGKAKQEKGMQPEFHISKVICEKPQTEASPDQAEFMRHLQSAATARFNQEQDEQNLLVYLALVGQVSQNGNNNNNNGSNRNGAISGVSNELANRFVDPSAVQQHSLATQDILAQRILEQAMLERQLETLSNSRDYRLFGQSPMQQQLLQQQQQQQQQPFSFSEANNPFATGNHFAQQQQQQQQQANQLADLERLVQLQQLRQLGNLNNAPSAWSLSATQPPVPNNSLFAEPSQRQLNEDLIIAQAIEQARIAQFLQSLQP